MAKFKSFHESFFCEIVRFFFIGKGGSSLEELTHLTDVIQSCSEEPFKVTLTVVREYCVVSQASACYILSYYSGVNIVM